MVRRFCGRPSWLFTVALIASLVAAVPAFAQSTGMVKGVVMDDKGQPVTDAKVIIEMNGGTGRKFETKTNKKGEYIQIGLASGSYKVTAEKDKLGSAPAAVTVRANTTQEANLTLAMASAAATKEAQAKNAAITKVFDEGVQLSNAGNHDAAIAKFQEAIAIIPTCYNCYNNIAFSYTAKKDYAQAETAYKKSIEVKPEDAAAYVGLAGIYFNTGKAADAKPLVEKAVSIDPANPDAHYILGMTLVAENPAKAKTEFEEFVKLAPTAPNAAIAKSLIAELEKQIK
ncbi:MAG TPA: tetratricopeptide repeat protein [Vicinamibacterales bacterium]|nr:tetratricopeptide repeat protein [Vicinamibacterales bacterium]